MAHREMEAGQRAVSAERKSALPVPYGPRHQRSSSVGPNTQNVYSTPCVRQSSSTVKSSTRGTSTRKYPGNVQVTTGDKKEFQRSAVNKVRSYFQQNSGLNICWLTFGSQPLSVAAYVEMFNFLFRKLFNGINLDSKNYVDEIPRYMKELSYPVNIQKSSLHAINTKSFFPSVLNMLVFLVELVSMCDESLVSQIVCSHDDDSLDFKVQSEVFCHSLRIYKIWNFYEDGDDERNISLANQELKEKLKKLLHVDERILNDLENEMKILKLELDKNKCVGLQEEVQMLQTTISHLCTDEEKANLEINKLANGKNEWERQTEHKKNKIFSLEESSNKKRTEIQRLEELCETQEMTVEDKQKNLQECNEVRERIKIAEELCSSLQTTSFHTDREISKLKAEVDNPFVELKTFLCEKSSIPQVSAIKVGQRYSIEDWKYAKNELNNLKKQLVSRKLQLGKGSLELKKAVCMLKEQLDQLLEDKRNGKRHLKDLDECKQKMKNDIKEVDANVIEREEEKGENEQTLLSEKISRLQHINAELEDCKKQYTDIIAECEQEIKEEQDNLKLKKDKLLEVKNNFINKSGYTGHL